MKRSYLGVIALCLLAMAMMLTACGGGGGGGGGSEETTTTEDAGRTIVGAWVTTDATNPAEVNNVWVFNANGTGSYTAKVGGVSTTYPMTYTLTGSNLAVHIQDVDIAYTLTWITDTRIKIALDAANSAKLNKVT